MEKMISSPSEPFLVIRVSQKCQKPKKHEKLGFLGFFSNSSKTVKSIFLIFGQKTPLTRFQRLENFFPRKLVSFLRKN